MRSMWWQLGILGTISAFAFGHRETKKNLCGDGVFYCKHKDILFRKFVHNHS